MDPHGEEAVVAGRLAPDRRSGCWEEGDRRREGTPTLPLLLAARKDEVVRKALAGGPIDGALVRVAQTGALEEAREASLGYAAEARSHLERGRYRPELEALTHIVVERRN